MHGEQANAGLGCARARLCLATFGECLSAESYPLPRLFHLLNLPPDIHHTERRRIWWQLFWRWRGAVRSNVGHVNITRWLGGRHHIIRDIDGHAIDRLSFLCPDMTL
jgi:hypothetical protein